MATPTWRVGFAKATTWGTPVAVGAGHLLKIESETMPEMIPEPIADDNVGDILSGSVLQGNVAGEGTVVPNMRFEGQTQLLMAMLMGQSNDGVGPGNTTPEEVEAGVAYLHHMLFQAQSDGLYGTLLMDKGLTGVNKQWQYTTCKVSQVEDAHNNSKRQGTFTLIARSLNRTVTIPSGGDAQIAALTGVDGLLNIFQQVELRIGEVTGTEGNLDANDEILVTDAKVTVNRNINGEFESGTNAGFAGEPDINGFPEAMLEFTIQDYKDLAGSYARAATLLEDYQTIQTGREPKIYKASLVWTGNNLPGTAASNKYFARYDFPAMTLMTGPANAGAPGQKTPVTFTMKAQTPSSASLPDGTDWTWVSAGTDPFRYQVQNSVNASILA